MMKGAGKRPVFDLGLSYCGLKIYIPERWRFHSIGVTV
jgi:hypothetical protein